MTFPFNFFRDNNQENVNSDTESIEKQVKELSKKLQNQIERENARIKRRDYFVAQRKSDEVGNFVLEDNPKWDLKKVDFDQLSPDLAATLDSLVPDLASPASSPSQIFEYQERLNRIQGEYQDYISQNRPFVSQILKQSNDVGVDLLMKEEKLVVKQLLHILIKRVKKVTGKSVHALSRISISVIVLMLKVIIAYAIYRLIKAIYFGLIYLLKLTFRVLKDKVLIARANSKKQLRSEEDKLAEIKESKEFWNQHVGWLSQVIKIGRGGNLIPLQEINIYEFSDFDEEQALLSISPIIYFIKYQKQLLQLQKVLGDSETSLIQPKSFRLPFKRFKKKIYVIIGVSLFLMNANSESLISSRNQNLFQYERIVSRQSIVTSVLPRPELRINDSNVNDETNIQALYNEPQEGSKRTQLIESPSRFTKVHRVRKKAKLVRLSDLPPLPDDYSDVDVDIYLPASPRSTNLKVR